MTQERVIDDVKDDRRLPGWDYSINKWIGISLAQQGDEDSREFLRKLLSEHGYTGNSPVILFGIYDFLAQDSEEALMHGIKAYELSGHDVEKVAQLKNPGRLVSYVIDVTDEIETLTLLQERLFYATRIHPQNLGYNRPIEARSSNANASVVELGLEINERLADINKSDLKQGELLDFEQWSKLYEMRRIALERAVLAQQQLTDDSAETLRILSLYDSLTGTANIHGLDPDVLDSFMRTKLQLEKPAIDGEVPDNLKAGAYYEEQRSFWGITDLEQEWKMRHFGRQKKSYEKDQEPSKEQREQEKKQRDEDYRKMLEDPWAFYAEQLTLLGMTKKMTYAEARTAFRVKIKEHSSAFAMTLNPAEYAESQEAAKKVLSAWEIVSALYKLKEKEGSAAA